MKAYQFAHRDAELAVVQLSEPVPEAAEVRICVAACGLNFADLLIAKGTYQDQPAFPAIPGMEVCGTIDALGPDAPQHLLGKRIAVFVGSGGMAEKVLAPSQQCITLSDAVSDEAAAALPVAYGTSHLALSRTARLAAGETLLVTGASGGVGLTAIELGKRMGARVIAVARGSEKGQIARSAGADHVLDSAQDNIVGAMRELGGADVVYDVVGGAGFGDLVRATRPEGRILLVGFASGELPQIKPNHLLVKNISVHGFNWGGFLAFRPEVLRASLAELFDWLAEGQLTPHISHVLPMSQAAQALDLLRNRAASGKIILKP